jgi:hypothetical protein
MAFWLKNTLSIFLEGGRRMQGFLSRETLNREQTKFNDG